MIIQAHVGLVSTVCEDPIPSHAPRYTVITQACKKSFGKA